MSKIALVVSVAALVIAGFVLLRDLRGGNGEGHRCGDQRQLTACVGNDTPLDYHARHCVPLQRTSGVMYWQCRKRR